MNPQGPWLVVEGIEHAYTWVLGGINVPSPCVVMCCFMSLTTRRRASGGYHAVSSCTMFYTYLTWVSRCKFLYHVIYLPHLGITLLAIGLGRCECGERLKLQAPNRLIVV